MLNWLKKTRGILGLNARNLNFIKPGNPKAAVRLVDSKLRTKKRLLKYGLPTCSVLGVIHNRRELFTFDWASLPNSFVLKPNRGMGGEGIMVTFGRKKNGKWVLPLNKEAKLEDIILRTGNILDGDFSLTNAPDKAFFEERLKIHPAFKLYSYKGIPDIRVVVYNKVPIMAMLRLPTKSSEGRANLHKGGLGLGIDIATGITTYAIQDDRLIEYLPEVKLPLRGIQIPFWNEILEIAVNAASACGLNYTGVDIAIDREKGPVILELNARPGLSIQIANLAPLKERLQRVRGLKILTTKRGIKMAKQLFGIDFDSEVEEITGKKVLSVINKIKVRGKDKKEIEIEAKMDTGAGMSSIDESLAIELGYGEELEFFNSFGVNKILTSAEAEQLEKEKTRKKILENKNIADCEIIYSSHGISYRLVIELEFEIAGKEIKSKTNVYNRENMQFPIIIGKNDLKGFLIDPTK